MSIRSHDSRGFLEKNSNIIAEWIILHENNPKKCNANFAVNEAIKKNKERKRPFLWPSYSSSSEMGNDACEKSSFKDDTYVTSLSSSLVNTKKRSALLTKSSPKQI